MYVAKLDLTDNVNSTDKYFNSAMISECMSKLWSEIFLFFPCGFYNIILPTVKRMIQKFLFSSYLK